MIAILAEHKTKNQKKGNAHHMKLDINGHDTKIKVKEMIAFTAKPKSDELGNIQHYSVSGKLMKVEMPYIVFLKVDPWNSELHQFETKEEAGEFIASLAK
jgi:hypothetical protein